MDMYWYLYFVHFPRILSAADEVEVAPAQRAPQTTSQDDSIRRARRPLANHTTYDIQPRSNITMKEGKEAAKDKVSASQKRMLQTINKNKMRSGGR